MILTITEWEKIFFPPSSVIKVGSHPPISKVCQMTLRADEIRLIMSPSEMKVRRGPHREQKKKICSVREALGERKEKDKQRRRDGGREGTSEWREGREEKNI